MRNNGTKISLATITQQLADILRRLDEFHKDFREHSKEDITRFEAHDTRMQRLEGFRMWIYGGLGVLGMSLAAIIAKLW